MMAFVFLPAYVVVQNQLPVASAFFVLLEQVRKEDSFVHKKNTSFTGKFIFS
jgi:hypothetical protein